MQRTQWNCILHKKETPLKILKSEISTYEDIVILARDWFTCMYSITSMFGSSSAHSYQGESGSESDDEAPGSIRFWGISDRHPTAAHWAGKWYIVHTIHVVTPPKLLARCAPGSKDREGLDGCRRFLEKPVPDLLGNKQVFSHISH